MWRAREKLTMMGVGVQQAALVWKIARNAAIDNVRSLHTSEPLSESYDTVDEDRTLLQELHEQIAQLTEPDKSIVTMQLEGYSYEEIGKKLNISEKNVSVRLVRAREKIRGKMVNTL